MPSAARPPAGCLRATQHVATEHDDAAAWRADEAELAALRAWLGSRPADSLSFEMLRAGEPGLGGRAAALMARDGFVVIADALAPPALAQMRWTTAAAIETIMAEPRTSGGRAGNRGGSRFSFGSAFMAGVLGRRAATLCAALSLSLSLSLRTFYSYEAAG